MSTGMTGLLRAALRLIGSLPLALLQRIGEAIAAVLRPLNTREVRVARRNIELCFPELDGIARRALLHRILAETTRTALETCRIWSRDDAAATDWVREVDGIEVLHAARSGGRGVIIAAPHLGNWELFGRFLATLGPLCIVYRVPQWAAAEGLLIAGRGGDSVQQLRAEPSSVRPMLRALKQGRMLGILPDQRPKIGEGEFAPFFGQPTLSMTLLSRLAHSAGVEVVFGFAERLPRARGFRVRFLPAPEGIADADPKRAVAALNAGLEQCVRLCPEQYQWTYKRFSLHPDGKAANPYRQK